MMRSLYSGVSGLRNHQTRMDVIGNNVANVNTTGYKTSRVVFQDIYSQTSKSASGGVGTTVGGTNPIQIGLGVTLATIDVLHNSAATQRTDNPLDLCVEGDGFFIAKVGNQNMYTRAGNFYVDNSGYLVTSGGNFVQGVQASTSVQTRPTTSPITLTNLLIGNDGAATPANYIDIAIDDTGEITGVLETDATGSRVAIGWIALGTFTNNGGLEKKGSSFYGATPNSGAVVVRWPQENCGKINPGGLEMSNVDLAAEFTDMIVTQRGFQANSRVITTSDSLLEELVNLKR